MKKLSLFFPEKLVRIVGFGVILLAILFGLTAFNVGGQAALWENVHWTVATWMMVFLGSWGWKNSIGMVKKVRGVFTIGAVSYALGQILWDFQWAFDQIAFPSLADVFYLGFAPFLIMGLIWTIHRQVSRWEEIALYLDVGTLLAAFTTAVLAFYGPHIQTHSWGTMGVLVGYPVAFLVLAAVAWVVALSLRAQIGVAGPYPLITGLAFSGVCWVLWNSQTLDGGTPSGTLVGYGFSLAHLWVGVGLAVWEIRPSESLQVAWWSRFILGAMPVLVVPWARGAAAAACSGGARCAFRWRWVVPTLNAAWPGPGIAKAPKAATSIAPASPPRLRWSCRLRPGRPRSACDWFRQTAASRIASAAARTSAGASSLAYRLNSRCSTAHNAAAASPASMSRRCAAMAPFPAIG